jgi:hypothetical protein
LKYGVVVVAVALWEQTVIAAKKEVRVLEAGTVRQLLQQFPAKTILSLQVQPELVRKVMAHTAVFAVTDVQAVQPMLPEQI